MLPSDMDYTDHNKKILVLESPGPFSIAFRLENLLPLSLSMARLDTRMDNDEMFIIATGQGYQ
jgi:hypothetical protein